MCTYLVKWRDVVLLSESGWTQRPNTRKKATGERKETPVVGRYDGEHLSGA